MLIYINSPCRNGEEPPVKSGGKPVALVDRCELKRESPILEKDGWYLNKIQTFLHCTFRSSGDVSASSPWGGVTKSVLDLKDCTFIWRVGKRQGRGETGHVSQSGRFQTRPNLPRFWGTPEALSESLSEWWEVGKSQIGAFCQNCTAQTSYRNKRTRPGERNQSAGDKNRVALNEALTEEKNESLDRLWKKSISTGEDLLTDGALTSDPAEMRQLVVDFYTDLYWAEGCKSESVTEPFQDRGKRSELHHYTRWAQRSCETAVRGSLRRNGRITQPSSTACLDDLERRLLRSILRTGYCLVGSLGAILPLLPKKGGLGLLKSWRSVILPFLNIT